MRCVFTAYFQNIMKSHRVKVIVFNISPFVEGFELKTVDDVIYIALPSHSKHKEPMDKRNSLGKTGEELTNK